MRGVDTWKRIDRTGFYPQVVKRALRRALGGEAPVASLCQVDAAFDRGSVFRHLTVATLTRDCVVQLHVDELEDGGASVATSIHRSADIAGYSTMEILDDPQRARGLSEITVAVDLRGARRIELEPAHCDDPDCAADHGYTAQSFPDDLSIRVSAAADGEVQVVPARSGRVVQGRAAQRAEAPTAGAFGQGRKATPPGSAIVLRRM